MRSIIPEIGARDLAGSSGAGSLRAWDRRPPLTIAGGSVKKSQAVRSKAGATATTVNTAPRQMQPDSLGQCSRSPCIGMFCPASARRNDSISIPRALSRVRNAVEVGRGHTSCKHQREKTCARKHWRQGTKNRIASRHLSIGHDGGNGKAKSRRVRWPKPHISHNHFTGSFLEGLSQLLSAIKNRRKGNPLSAVSCNRLRVLARRQAFASYLVLLLLLLLFVFGFLVAGWLP